MVILVVALLFVVGALTLSNRGNNSGNRPSSVKNTKVVDYVNRQETRLMWTQQGRLVGDDQRKSVRVTVTPSKRIVEVLSGYEERVEKSQEFNNNQTAFETFSRALEAMSYGRERTVRQTDERAACPFGFRYIYELKTGAQSVFRSWSDSCTPNDGTFGGGNRNAQDINRLFQAQITDYNRFTAGVNL